MQEASVGHTLSEVHSFSFNGPKDEQLRMKRAKDMKDECEEVTVQQLTSFYCVISAKYRCKEHAAGSLTAALKHFNASQNQLT